MRVDEPTLQYTLTPTLAACNNRGSPPAALEPCRGGRRRLDSKLAQGRSKLRRYGTQAWVFRPNRRRCTVKLSNDVSVIARGSAAMPPGIMHRVGDPDYRVGVLARALERRPAHPRPRRIAARAERG